MYYFQKIIGYKKRIISVTRRRAKIHSSNTCSVLISISVLTSVISTPSTFSAACPTPYRENKKIIKLCNIFDEVFVLLLGRFDCLSEP